MATTVTFNGVLYSVPAYQDVGWAQGTGNLSSYLIALATGSLQQTGGNFTLTADVNFGASFGLISSYFTSRSANPATAGAIRLSNTDTIDWRNFLNNGNLALGVNTSNQLTYQGAVISAAGTTALTNAHIFVGNASNIATDVAVSGDVTLANTGAVTLNTVNSNVGSFTNSSITVNAKGLITAAANGTTAVTSVSGTANQIDSTGGTTPVLSISSTFVFPGTISANTHKITSLSNGTAATDAAAFGQIRYLQTVQATGTTATATTSSTFTATVITGSITPGSASSRIKVTVSSTVNNQSPANTLAEITLARGTTNLAGAAGFQMLEGGFSASQAQVPFSFTYIDSPATTSATTYTVYLRSTNNSTSVGVNPNSTTWVIIMEEIV